VWLLKKKGGGEKKPAKDRGKNNIIGGQKGVGGSLNQRDWGEKTVL